MQLTKSLQPTPRQQHQLSERKEEKEEKMSGNDEKQRVQSANIECIGKHLVSVVVRWVLSAYGRIQESTLFFRLIKAFIYWLWLFLSSLSVCRWWLLAFGGVAAAAAAAVFDICRILERSERTHTHTYIYKYVYTQNTNINLYTPERQRENARKITEKNITWKSHK